MRRRADGLAIAQAVDDLAVRRLRIYMTSCVYPTEPTMQVSKWGNSLAVRLPAAVVEALGLKEGDEIEIEVADPRSFRVSRPMSREEAIERLRKFGWRMPADFKF